MVKMYRVIEVVLVKSNLADNQYQQNLGRYILYMPNKSYDFLLIVEPRNLVFLKIYDTVFDDIIITLTGQSCRQLEREENVNFTLLINKQKLHVIL